MATVLFGAHALGEAAVEVVAGEARRDAEVLTPGAAVLAVADLPLAEARRSG